MWANLTANPLAEERKPWGVGVGAMNTLEVKRMGSGASVGVCLREVGGRDLKGNKVFKIDLGLKIVFPGQEYYEYFL